MSLCFFLTLIQSMYQKATCCLHLRTGVIQDVSTPFESRLCFLHNHLLLWRLIQPVRIKTIHSLRTCPTLALGKVQNCSEVSSPDQHPPHSRYFHCLSWRHLPSLFILHIILYIQELDQVQSRLFFSWLAVPKVFLTVIPVQCPIHGTVRQRWITPWLQII